MVECYGCGANRGFAASSPNAMTRRLRNALETARQEHGYTLVELLIVMLIMLVVIGALVDGFASASKAEVDQSNRAGDQQSARQALALMRLDIHCALSAQTPTAIVDGFGNTT